MNAMTVAGQYAPPMQIDSPVFDQGQFQNMVAVAELMAKCRLVPEALQGKPADCFLIVEQSRRWGMSPFAVAQEAYVVKGRLLYSGKLTAAVVNIRAGLEAPLAFEFHGEGDALEVVVSGTIAGEDAPRYYSITLGQARSVAGSSSLWKTDPRQQLCYFGARFWARRHAPHVMLGLFGDDETAPASPRDVTPRAEPVPEPPADVTYVYDLQGVELAIATCELGAWIRNAAQATANWDECMALANMNPDHSDAIMLAGEHVPAPPPEPKPARRTFLVLDQHGTTLAGPFEQGRDWLAQYRSQLGWAEDKPAIARANIETLRIVAGIARGKADGDLEAAEAMLEQEGQAGE